MFFRCEQKVINKEADNGAEIEILTYDLVINSSEVIYIEKVNKYDFDIHLKTNPSGQTKIWGTIKGMNGHPIVDTLTLIKMLNSSKGDSAS